MGLDLGKRLKLEGKLKSWVISCFKLCKFGDLGFVIVLK